MKSELVSLTAMGGDLLSLAGAFLTFICVLALAYWCSRLLGKKLGSISSGRNMKVIEQLPLGGGGLGRGAGGQLLIVKIQSEIYLIGVSQAGVQLLTRLEGEFEEASPAGATAMPVAFGEVFKKYAALRGKEKEKKDE
jgi:flagellar biogenesis protein FliO